MAPAVNGGPGGGGGIGDLEKLLTPSEVSELLGVPIKTLYRWSYRRAAGYDDGPEVLRIGGHLRYRPQALRAYLERAAS